MTDWQPIESAPLDKVILAGSAATVHDGTFYEANVCPCEVSEWQGKLTYKDLSNADRDGDYMDVWPTPTHWMPLPEAPNA